MKILKYLFLLMVVKPIVSVILGLNIRGKENLPKDGPAIIVANHNSHLDVLVIICLFSMRYWKKLRPVGAIDYFFSNKYMAWFAHKVLDVVPIDRSGNTSKENIFVPCEQALKNNDIIIIFPEGTRGEPEHLGNLRKGICHLSNKIPNVPIIPIFLYGLGKSLPKGEALLVPFFVDVFVNKPIYNTDQDSTKLLENITKSFLNNHNKVHSV